MADDNDDRPVTRGELRLELKSVRSDLKLLVFLSIAANQALGHISIPSGVTVSAAILVGLKVALAR